MPKPLIIGIDVRDLRLAKTGTKTYLAELCKEFQKMQTEDLQFRFIDTKLPVYTGKQKLLKLTEHLMFQLWKQLVLPLKAYFNHCDLLFCTDTCVPFIHLGYKTVAVIHDAFCFESPENYGKLWLWLYKNTAIPAAKKAIFVVTPTQYSKTQIIHYTGLDGRKIVVIPEGPKSLERTEAATLETTLKNFKLKKGNYLLHVGAMFKRKNLPAMVKAFAKIKAERYTDLKLVLAGSTSRSSPESDLNEIMNVIKEYKLSDHVVITGYLADDALSCIYQGALTYVFPSVNEGFGIPVLEAFKYELPVLVSNNTCLPEVGGDAVLQFNPFDINDMATKITTVIDDRELRNIMVTKGTARLRQFSWQNTALQLVQSFRQAI